MKRKEKTKRRPQTLTNYITQRPPDLHPNKIYYYNLFFFFFGEIKCKLTTQKQIVKLVKIKSCSFTIFVKVKLHT